MVSGPVKIDVFGWGRSDKGYKVYKDFLAYMVVRDRRPRTVAAHGAMLNLVTSLYYLLEA